MKLFTDKLKKIRHSRKFTTQELADKMGINRLTLCAWENEKRVPSEPKIRMLAKILNISVEEISDLKPDIPVSSFSLANLKSSISDLLITDKDKSAAKFNYLIEGITNLNKELTDAKLIINAMTNSLNALFYVKNSELKYVIANETFLNNAGLNRIYNVSGRTDYDFFPKNEAESNNRQDADVIKSGKSILDEEGYIPGSRKKKWGIISKIPIFDSKGNIAGLAGSFVDITKRKLAEEMREILESNMNEWEKCLSVFSVNDKKYLFLSNAVERITGYPKENFYKIYRFNYNYCVHPDDKYLFEEVFEKHPNSKFELTYRIIRKDGEERKVFTQVYPGSKEYLKEYVITLTEDITNKV